MREEDSPLDATISGEIGGLGGDVTLDDLFGDDWMAAHTDSESIGAFIRSFDDGVDDQESFENLPEDEWNDHVAAHSEFDDWRSMLSAAVESYVGVARPTATDAGGEGRSAEASE